MAAAGRDFVAPLLRTKLAVPSSPRLVVRESLIDALSSGLPRRLSLIYGPAGCGKTMLVAQWVALARAERPMAWLSLEAGDNDPARFWTYVIGALRSVLPGIGGPSLAMLRAPGVNLVDEAIPPLVNELADVSEQLVLVLDDYHAIQEPRIHEGHGFADRAPSSLSSHCDDNACGATVKDWDAARAGSAQRDRCRAAALLTFRNGVDAQRRARARPCA